MAQDYRTLEEELWLRPPVGSKLIVATDSGPDGPTPQEHKPPYPKHISHPDRTRPFCDLEDCHTGKKPENNFRRSPSGPAAQNGPTPQTHKRPYAEHISHPDGTRPFCDLEDCYTDKQPENNFRRSHNRCH